MSNLELVLWVLALTAVGALLFGPGMWSQNYGWGFLERLFGKKQPPKDEAKPPSATVKKGPGPHAR